VKRVLAIADDLTGALEVGALFAAAGMRSVVTAGEKEVFDDPVVVIDTETRHASCAEAESIVEKRAAGWPSLVYKKTDSTLRGNIGAELRALHRLYGGPIAYVPAYPELGRTVVDGSVYVDGVPLANTWFAHDPLNPVHEGKVRSLLDPACDCVVFDGQEIGDVGRAADAILASGTYRIVAGPGAIGAAIASRLGAPSKTTWPSVRTCLVVAGSRHEVSCRQIQEALDSQTISLNAEAAWRLFHWEAPEGASPADAATDTGRRVGRMLAERSYDGLLVFGGDTAFGILANLGLPALGPIGEVVPGVAVSRIDGRREILITKAGGFGTPDLVATLKTLLQ